MATGPSDFSVSGLVVTLEPIFEEEKPRDEIPLRLGTISRWVLMCGSGMAEAQGWDTVKITNACQSPPQQHERNGRSKRDRFALGGTWTQRLPISDYLFSTY